MILRSMMLRCRGVLLAFTRETDWLSLQPLNVICEILDCIEKGFKPLSFDWNMMSFWCDDAWKVRDGRIGLRRRIVIVLQGKTRNSRLQMTVT
jgi:hypothetical protein